MTEHSIEELERQFQAAESRAAEANKLAREAKARLVSAKLDATGLIGHVVSYTRSGVTRKFMVEGFARWTERSLRGPKIKKDGHLSQMQDDCLIDRLTDHGPYEVPVK